MAERLRGPMWWSALAAAVPRWGFAVDDARGLFRRLPGTAVEIALAKRGVMRLRR